MSDGEGDEEEGERQRLLEEARQDRIKTKKILEALANGQKGANRQQNENVTRGLYGLDELISGDIADSKVQKEDEEGELEENLDYDDDEELQAKYINQMKARIRGQPEETAIDELSDEEDENSDADENSTTLTPEEREMKAKIAAIEKENYRRYFEQALRNRALRNSNRQEEHPPHSIPPLLNQRTPSLVQGNVEPTAAPQLIRTSTAPSIPLPPPPTVVVRDGTELKRRVSMPPRKVCTAYTSNSRALGGQSRW